MLELVRAVYAHGERMGRNGSHQHPALQRLYADWAGLPSLPTPTLPETAERLPKTAVVGPFPHEITVEVAAGMLDVSIRRARDLARDELEPRGGAYRGGCRGRPWVLDHDAVERLAVARYADAVRR
jgi:hypothetical protein